MSLASIVSSPANGRNKRCVGSIISALTWVNESAPSPAGVAYAGRLGGARMAPARCAHALLAGMAGDLRRIPPGASGERGDAGFRRRDRASDQAGIGCDKSASRGQPQDEAARPEALKAEVQSARQVFHAELISSRGAVSSEDGRDRPQACVATPGSPGASVPCDRHDAVPNSIKDSSCVSTLPGRSARTRRTSWISRVSVRRTHPGGHGDIGDRVRDRR